MNAFPSLFLCGIQPYVPSPAEEMCEGGIAAAWAGGVDGREVIDRFVQHAPVSKLLSGCGGWRCGG